MVIRGQNGLKVLHYILYQFVSIHHFVFTSVTTQLGTFRTSETFDICLLYNSWFDFALVLPWRSENICIKLKECSKETCKFASFKKEHVYYKVCINTNMTSNISLFVCITLLRIRSHFLPYWPAAAAQLLSSQLKCGF